MWIYTDVDSMQNCFYGASTILKLSLDDFLHTREKDFDYYRLHPETKGKDMVIHATQKREVLKKKSVSTAKNRIASLEKCVIFK